MGPGEWSGVMRREWLAGGVRQKQGEWNIIGKAEEQNADCDSKTVVCI